MNIFLKKRDILLLFLYSLKNELAKAGSIFPQLSKLKENLPKIYESRLGGDLTI